MVDAVADGRNLDGAERRLNELSHVIVLAVVLAVESRPLVVILYVREHVLDRVEVWAVRLVEDDFQVELFAQSLDVLCVVHRQVVHEDSNVSVAVLLREIEEIL